ncbi:MAG TPA: hypothetical protein VK671_03130 [Mucilaginibacter sp.]|jgi:hypothetical protein|nr:hypothetical protein [Mucilaginibacter sp.]
MAVKIIVQATSIQKNNFTTQFAEIVKSNDHLRDKYKIQFFDSTSKSNYLFNGLDGKSINVLQFMTIEEAEEYKKLKSHWQD